jgi:hypothetical protein
LLEVSLGILLVELGLDDELVNEGLDLLVGHLVDEFISIEVLVTQELQIPILSGQGFLLLSHFQSQTLYFRFVADLSHLVEYLDIAQKTSTQLLICAQQVQNISGLQIFQCHFEDLTMVHLTMGRVQQSSLGRVERAEEGGVLVEFVHLDLSLLLSLVSLHLEYLVLQHLHLPLRVLHLGNLSLLMTYLV